MSAAIFSICGAAGMGKSRLIEEFKTQLDLERIQWIEGHAYEYFGGKKQLFKG